MNYDETPHYFMNLTHPVTYDVAGDALFLIWMIASEYFSALPRIFTIIHFFFNEYLLYRRRSLQLTAISS